MSTKLIGIFLISFGLFSCGNSSEQLSMREEDINNSIEKEGQIRTNGNLNKLSLAACPELPKEATYPDVIFQNYSYDRSQMMFGSTRPYLGTKTPKMDEWPFFINKKGTHIHLNIDNKTHYLSNKNIFEYHLTDGDYQLFAFVNRSNYISVKGKKALIGKSIKIKNKKLTFSKDLETSAIVYNAPIGLYKNEAGKKVILDFVLYNTTIDENENTVRVTIDHQKTFTINRYHPYYIQGLLPGEHHCKLELLNSQGDLIAAPVSNTFTITEEPPNS